ncbi:MAG: hypothetical protein RL591_351 [Planctomycetota bacterium]
MWRIAQAASASPCRINRRVNRRDVGTKCAYDDRRFHGDRCIFGSKNGPDFVASLRVASEDGRPESRSIEVAHFNKLRRSDCARSCGFARAEALDVGLDEAVDAVPNAAVLGAGRGRFDEASGVDRERLC